MNPRRTAALLAFAGGLAFAAGAFAQAPVIDARDLDERLKRLERVIESEGLLKLFDEVESLAAEVRELRGQIEVQSHAIDQMKQSQRELYLDIDQRLQSMASTPPPATQAESPSPPPAEAEPATAPAQTATATPPAPATDTGSGTATGTAPAAGTPAAGIDPFAEQQAYQGAFDLLKSGRYEDAAVAFRQFLTEYPVGSYADNAQYWLGETYYITREFEAAVQEFERLVSTSPNSEKLTHALLKIGYAHDALGNRAAAERVLEELVANHPQSAAAGLARKRLLAIRQ